MKTAFITGSSIGIGASIALEFAKNNYNIVLTYNTHFKEATALKMQIINDYNVKVLLLKLDVSKEGEVRDAVDKIIGEFEKIDVLVNNAGIALDANFEDKTVADFKKVIDVNLIGTFIVSKIVSNYMLKEKTGCIINISSTNGIDTINPYSLDYDASKAGVISLTHNLAKQFAPYIRVNSIAPGWTNTEAVLSMDLKIIEEEKKKILLNRFANVEEIASVAIFLASSKASYINDSIIRVDGGVK